MSYDISLVDFDGYPVKVDRHCEGGNIVPGGSTDAMISITYNYSKYFYETIDEKLGIRWIYGRRLGDCIKRLMNAVHILGVYKDEDYWAATPGNAGYVLGILMMWAKQYPDAVFKGD